eukprot:275934-Pelagomonas_calceolata.AAC.2
MKVAEAVCREALIQVLPAAAASAIHNIFLQVDGAVIWIETWLQCGLEGSVHGRAAWAKRSDSHPSYRTLSQSLRRKFVTFRFS